MHQPQPIALIFDEVSAASKCSGGKRRTSVLIFEKGHPSTIEDILLIDSTSSTWRIICHSAWILKVLRLSLMVACWASPIHVAWVTGLVPCRVESAANQYAFRGPCLPKKSEVSWQEYQTILDQDRGRMYRLPLPCRN
jgi:hypothetical protein